MALCLEIQQHVPHSAVVLFSDEAHFHLCGAVSKQNFTCWAESKVRELHERLFALSSGDWSAVAEFGIWGPDFFEENNVTVTVNSDRFCEMLDVFCKPKLNMILDMDNVWFRQGGPTAPLLDMWWEFWRQWSLLIWSHCVAPSVDFPIHLIKIRASFFSGDTSNQR